MFPKKDINVRTLRDFLPGVGTVDTDNDVTPPGEFLLQCIAELLDTYLRTFSGRD